MVLEINEPTFVGDSCKRFMNKIASMPEYVKVSIDEFKVIKFTILQQLIQMFPFGGIGIATVTLQEMKLAKCLPNNILFK